MCCKLRFKAFSDVVSSRQVRYYHFQIIIFLYNFIDYRIMFQLKIILKLIWIRFPLFKQKIIKILILPNQIIISGWKFVVVQEMVYILLVKWPHFIIFIPISNMKIIKIKWFQKKFIFYRFYAYFKWTGRL